MSQLSHIRSEFVRIDPVNLRKNHLYFFFYYFVQSPGFRPSMAIKKFQQHMNLTIFSLFFSACFRSTQSYGKDRISTLSTHLVVILIAVQT